MSAVTARISLAIVLALTAVIASGCTLPGSDAGTLGWMG